MGVFVVWKQPMEVYTKYMLPIKCIGRRSVGQRLFLGTWLLLGGEENVPSEKVSISVALR